MLPNLIPLLQYVILKAHINSLIVSDTHQNPTTCSDVSMRLSMTGVCM